MWKPHRAGSHQITDLGLERISLHTNAQTGLASWGKIFNATEYMKILPTGLSNNQVILQSRLATGTFKQDTTGTFALASNSTLMMGIVVNGQQNNQPHYYTVNGSYSCGVDGHDSACEFVIGRVGSPIFPNLNASDPPGVVNGNMNILTSAWELGHDTVVHPQYTTEVSPSSVMEGNISRTILEGAFQSAGNDMPVAFGIRIQANDAQVIRKISLTLSIHKYTQAEQTFSPEF